MMTPWTALIPILVLATITLVTLHQTHLLMTLLTLEATLLLLTVMALSLTSFATQANAFLMIVILTLGACEASLGLAILTAMTRNYGSDLVTSLSINKC